MFLSLSTRSLYSYILPLPLSQLRNSVKRLFLQVIPSSALTLILPTTFYISMLYMVLFLCHLSPVFHYMNPFLFLKITSAFHYLTFFFLHPFVLSYASVTSKNIIFLKLNLVLNHRSSVQSIFAGFAPTAPQNFCSHTFILIHILFTAINF